MFYVEIVDFLNTILFANYVSFHHENCTCIYVVLSAVSGLSGCVGS